MTDQTPEQRLFLSWKLIQDAEARRQMAEQTLQGAQRDVFEKTARFNGQLEFVAGGPCSWKVDVEKGEVVVELLPEAAKSSAQIIELARAGADGEPAESESETAPSAQGAMADGSPIPE